MGTIAFRSISVAGAVVILLQTAFAQPRSPGLEQALQQLIESARPYSVTVIAESDVRYSKGSGDNGAATDTRLPLPHAVVDKRIGSGLIADTSGLVLTRRSVVEGMKQLLVITHRKDTLNASLLGYDDEYGIALLKIHPLSIPKPSFAHLQSLSEGNLVMILASSFSQKPGISLGRICSILKNNYLHVAANIWPGSIGAPVFNMNSQVVGIVAARMRRNTPANELASAIPAGECLVLPISVLLPRVRQIARDATEIAGWVGLSVTQYPGDGGKPIYKVTFVYEGSPAAQAGIRMGDEVLRFNGKPIVNLRRMAETIRHLSVGDSVGLELKRGGKVFTSLLRVQRRPPLYVLQQMQRNQVQAVGASLAKSKSAWPAQPIDRKDLIQRRIARLESELRTLKRMLKQPPPHK